MGCVGVHAVNAARRNHAQLRHRLAILMGRHVGLHGTDLDRAGMGAEHHTVTVFQIERIVHRTGRVIGRRVQCREIVEIRLDLRPFGHIEADGAEQLFDALQRADHWMQSTDTGPATRQRHIQRLGGQLGFECRLLQRIATSAQQRLDGRLGFVDLRPSRFAGIGIEFAKPLQQFGDRTALAEITCLDGFKGGTVRSFGKRSTCVHDELIELIHF